MKMISENVQAIKITSSLASMLGFFFLLSFSYKIFFHHHHHRQHFIHFNNRKAREEQSIEATKKNAKKKKFIITTKTIGSNSSTYWIKNNTQTVQYSQMYVLKLWMMCIRKKVCYDAIVTKSSEHWMTLYMKTAKKKNNLRSGKQ